MNDIMSKMLDDSTPNFNQHVVNGIATETIKGAPDYIDAIIRNGMKSATPKLQYHGWRRLSPKEDYDSMFLNNLNNRVSYDIAVSDIYKIELIFSYNGAMLPKRYLYLPFLDDGAVMRISDTKYHIVPVLSDTVVSPNEKEVFIRLLRDKLIFSRINRNIVCNGEKLSGQIISSTIYRTTVSNTEIGNVVPPTALYLLAEFGMKDAFLKYAGIEPIITNAENVDEYRDKYDVYESTRLKPRTIKDNNYIGHTVKILIPKDSKTPFTENMVTGIIYTFDILYANAPEMVDSVNSGDVEKEKMYWKILLGRIIFKNTYSVDRTYADMVDHFNTLKSYIDELIKVKLAEIDIHVNDFFDLLAVILTKYSNWLLNSKIYSNNIYNRYIDVLYYILYDIILGVNRSIFEISRKSAKKDLNVNELVRIFNRNLSPKKIFSISKSTNVNITLNLLDYSGDNKYLKTTSILELQERGKNVTKSKTAVFPNATRAITGSDLFLGSMLYLTKKAPTPKLRINPYVTLDIFSGKLKPSDEIKATIEWMDILFKGKMENNKIISDSELEVGVLEIKV